MLEHFNKDGYVVRSGLSGHLLACQGSALVHRVVLFDLIGYGPHQCAICKRHVNWGQLRPDRLDVDHIDCDKTNNDLANLREVCTACNARRKTETTHCKHGHEFTHDNTYVTSNGWRACRACRKLSQRRYVNKRALQESI